MSNLKFLSLRLLMLSSLFFVKSAQLAYIFKCILDCIKQRAFYFYSQGSDHPFRVDAEGGKGKPVTVAGPRRSSVRRLLCRVAVMSVVLAAVFGVFGVLWFYLGWISVVQLVLVALVAYLAASGGWRWFYVAGKTAPRDAM